MNEYILPFNKIHLAHLQEVGGKNSSLGEMFNKLQPLGIKIPDGFAITATAYRQFIAVNKIEDRLRELLGAIDHDTLSNLPEIAKLCRDLVSGSVIPDELKEAIVQSYKSLSSGSGQTISVAVRSSATAEDLPTASFAGQHDSFLNITGEDFLKTPDGS